MTEKPSNNEEEYFARLEIDRRRKVAEEWQSASLTDKRAQERILHSMKCPKCGMQLEEIPFGDVRVDKCFGCEGIWLDKAELEIVRKKETGFLARLLNVFR